MRNDYGAAIAAGLIRTREAAGLSLEQAAVAANVGVDTLRRAEEMGAIRMLPFERLCDLYEVSMDSVVGR
jgi:hypothetical protein